MMGIATFKTVAAGDGSPQSPSGYSFLVAAHAIATVLLLIALVTAVWQFMDWVVTPACPADTAAPSTVAAPSTAPVTSEPVLATKVLLPARATWPYQGSEQARIAVRTGECPCPQDR